MTDDQVNLVVQHLCEQLHLALRRGGQRGTSTKRQRYWIRSCLCKNCIARTGWRSAGVTIHHEAAGASEEPPWS